MGYNRLWLRTVLFECHVVKFWSHTYFLRNHIFIYQLTNVGQAIMQLSKVTVLDNGKAAHNNVVNRNVCGSRAAHVILYSIPQLVALDEVMRRVGS